MSLFALLLLSVGLAMDAMAVAGARGLAAQSVRVRDALVVALFFGGFQAGMPALGWAVGGAFAARITGWGHWVTFALLAAIGAKMIHEARETDDEEAKAASAPSPNVFGMKVLFFLAIATSIDALAAGVTLALADVHIAFACAVIGVVTGVLSFAGVYIGRRFGTHVGKRFDMVGGLVLIGLAVKTLVDHFRGG